MRFHVWAVCAYAVLALVFTWPLTLHLTTLLTGSPEGDTGIYVWNQWVFRHELLVNHANPYLTDRIFATTGPANLTLNNYTTFANLLALPLMGTFGVVATFNVIYLFLTVLSGYAMFLLARSIAGGRNYEAWVAGALFAWSPVLATRGAGHFSLVAAAPLPLFVLVLKRIDSSRRYRDAVALGLILDLAFWSDVYYVIYCLMLAVAYIGWQVVRVERRADRDLVARSRYWTLDAIILGLGAVIVAVAVTGGWALTVLGTRISVRALYTPVLMLTSLLVIRAVRHYRFGLAPVDPAALLCTTRLALVAGLVAALPLIPFLYAMGIRIAGGQWVSPPIYWRSSPIGVDLLAMALPNPNHPLAPELWRAWLSSRPDGYLESVASLPLTVVLVMGLAWYQGWRAPRLWIVLLLAFGWMALGPFVHIAGVNTYIPGPWTFLRYMPLVRLARNPARFAVPMMLAFAVLFAYAMSHLRMARGGQWRWLGWAIGALLLAELLPAARPLHPARIPTFYDRVADDHRDVRVLELPYGIRDGTFSLGNFTARTQFYQTRHGKPIMGGDLSRVSRRRVEATLRSPVLNTLVQLSEGKSLDAATLDRISLQGPGFMDASDIGYVVIDRDRSSPELIKFAQDAFRLETLATDGAMVLYRPLIVEARR